MDLSVTLFFIIALIVVVIMIFLWYVIYVYKGYNLVKQRIGDKEKNILDYATSYDNTEINFEPIDTDMFLEQNDDFTTF